MTTSTEESVEKNTITFETTTSPYLDLFRATWITMTSLLILILGMLGNIATVYIYTRSKKLRQNKVFELILAAFDI